LFLWKDVKTSLVHLELRFTPLNKINKTFKTAMNV
jgi:hypothetical protein